MRAYPTPPLAPVRSGAPGSELRFNSLTHAREVRDRNADLCLEDLEKTGRTKEQARDVLERVCRADQGWESEIDTWHVDFTGPWDGNGMPYFPWVSHLKQAIAYIYAAEHASNQNIGGETRASISTDGF